MIGKHSSHTNTNDNSTRLIHFAITRNIIVNSITFPQKNIYTQTWVSPASQTRNQKDHAVVIRRINIY